jgi:hypothetical protein
MELVLVMLKAVMKERQSRSKFEYIVDLCFILKAIYVGFELCVVKCI